LDVKTKPAEELTETVEVVEEVDEEQVIQDEVSISSFVGFLY
jgi:AdoMet-dependent rRNA methyltransferase SPB1